MTTSEGVDQVWTEDLVVQGMVSRVIVGPPPAYGFRLEIVGDDEVVVLDARTWQAGIPDLTEGGNLSLEFHPVGEHRLTLKDEAGPLFYVADGAEAPRDQSGLPVTFSLTEKTAYYEVRMSESLCRQTVSHWFVKVRASDETTPLAPGGTLVVKAGDWSYRVVAADSYQVEESDCGDQGKAATSLFWMRQAADGPREELPL